MFGTSFGTDAISLLKDDHRQVEELFDRFETSYSDTAKLQLAQEICQLLTLHTHVEEQLFYPALRTAGMEHELLDEAEVEHRALKQLIAELDGAGADAALFEARVKVLGAYVRHHVEEEENEIMPEARSLGVDLDILGEEILALKSRLQPRATELADAPIRAGRIAVLQVDGRGMRNPHRQQGASS